MVTWGGPRDALGLPLDRERPALPEVATRQRAECRHCGQALYRLVGKRIGMGCWWHVAPRSCRKPDPVEEGATG